MRAGVERTGERMWAIRWALVLTHWAQVWPKYVWWHAGHHIRGMVTLSCVVCPPDGPTGMSLRVKVISPLEMPHLWGQVAGFAVGGEGLKSIPPSRMSSDSGRGMVFPHLTHLSMVPFRAPFTSAFVEVELEELELEELPPTFIPSNRFVVRRDVVVVVVVVVVVIVVSTSVSWRTSHTQFPGAQ